MLGVCGGGGVVCVCGEGIGVVDVGRGVLCVWGGVGGRGRCCVCGRGGRGYWVCVGG